MHTLAIIEDQPVMLKALTAFFEQRGTWRITGAASTLAEGRALLERAAGELDVLALDIQLEDAWGLELIPLLRSLGSSAPVVVYSGFFDYAHVSAALAAGARGYVCKTHDENELEKALQSVIAGKEYIDPSAQSTLNIYTGMVSRLTARETEILSLVKQGLPNKKIAARLGISYRTVENLMTCIYDKTGIESRGELQKL